jgi:hypothetical protein
MFLTEPMKNAVKAPLQHSPDAFNRIGMCHSVNKLLRRMLHGLVNVLDFGNEQANGAILRRKGAEMRRS